MFGFMPTIISLYAIYGFNSILELWNQEVNKIEEKENPSSTVSIFGTRHEKKRDHKMGPIYLR